MYMHSKVIVDVIRSLTLGTLDRVLVQGLIP